MKSPGFEPSLQTAVKYGVQQFQPDQAQFTIKILFLNFDNIMSLWSKIDNII
jgi:hypothetical protein